MNLNSLPAELICAVVDQLDAESDISSLSRASRSLRQIVLRLLYQHNVRHNDAFVLIDAVVCGNTAAIINAINLGGVTIDMTCPTKSTRLKSPRLMARKPPFSRTHTAELTWTAWAYHDCPERTPIAISVLYNQLISAEVLLARYEPICPDATLNMAAHLGRTEIARMLLNKGHCSIPPAGQSSNNLLYYAIDGQKPDMIQLLFDHGLDLENAQQTNFTTMRRPSGAGDLLQSLMVAEQARFEALIRLLASLEVKLHEWISQSISPPQSLVATTVYSGQIDKFQFLVRSGLISGLSSSEDEVMEQFCAGHPDLLHHAARRGRPRLVRYLLKHHATRLSLGQLDANDMGIPLFNALSVSHGSAVPDVVRALVEVFPARNGKSSEEIRHEMFEVYRVSPQGRPRLTILLYCLQSNHHGRIDSRIKCSQTLQVLIDAGADPFTVCGRGRNALRYVLDSKCGDCAKVLLARMGSRAAVTMMRDLVESAGGGGGSGMTWQEAHINIEKGRHHNGSERYQLSMRDELSRWHVEFCALVEARRRSEEAGQ